MIDISMVGSAAITFSAQRHEVKSTNKDAAVAALLTM